MKWNIVSDSSCDLAGLKPSVGDIGFETVPLKIIVGEKEFVDDENINIDELLYAMSKEKRASSSACPSPDDFFQSFIKAENTICVTMTGALSGTFNCANVAKEMVKEMYPEKNIHIIDSKSTAGTLVLLIRKAQKLIESELCFSDICTVLDSYNTEMELVFALGAYDNLIKTGRMNAITAAIATHLGIRAVAEKTSKGEITVVKKPRGEQRAIEAMVEIMKNKKILKGEPVVINHCKNEEGALYAKKLIEESLHTKDITIYKCRALTSFYAMQKGIIIAY